MAQVTAGQEHTNELPMAPEDRAIQRVWTVLDAEKVRSFGPIHNLSARLENQGHSYQLQEGSINYYSQHAQADGQAHIVLDYETEAERRDRMSHQTLQLRTKLASGPIAPNGLNGRGNMAAREG